MINPAHYYICAVDVPINNSLLTYGHYSSLEIGSLVTIPLGRRIATGVVLREIKLAELEIEINKIKQITSIESSSYFKVPTFLKLYENVSSYYHYPLGQLIADTMPVVGSTKAKIKKIISDCEHSGILNQEQQVAVNKIFPEHKPLSYAKHLLCGITGSGKSFVYVELIKRVLSEGSSVLLLLPEINLTYKFIDFYKSHLPRDFEIICYNSDLTKQKKSLIWEISSQADKPRLYIGARSSIFLPLKKLGLIIVDEEHDSSFKQMDRCPYWAKDVASIRAKLENIPIVLGSATPSFETLANCEKGISNLIMLEQRYGGQTLPEIQLIKGEYDPEKKQDRPLSNFSLDKLKEVLAREEQAIIFINRLGFSNFLQCASCGHRFVCKNCDASLRYFKSKSLLSCSHCEYQEKAPKSCPACWCLDLKPIGLGTEQVVEFLRGQFPSTNVVRFDTEELTTSKKVEQALDDFVNEKARILVGTQMIAKGHTFPKVNTVIVLGVDQRINTPDFRSLEHTFQVIQQVAGRAGRIKGQGMVYIETKNPELPFWKFIIKSDYLFFAKTELEKRSEFELPPYSHMAHVLFYDKSREKCQGIASDFASELRRFLSNGLAVKVLLPRPATLERKKNLFTWVLVLYAIDRSKLHEVLSLIKRQLEKNKINNFKLDVDPLYEI